MTAAELIDKLLAEGCHPRHFQLGGGGDDCHCLENSGGIWSVFYSERGRDGPPEFTSSSEEQACAYFYRLIMGIQHWHLVGFFRDEAEARALQSLLAARGIQTIRNDMPSFRAVGDARYRVFVVGKDIFAVRALLADFDPTR